MGKGEIRENSEGWMARHVLLLSASSNPFLSRLSLISSSPSRSLPNKRSALMRILVTGGAIGSHLCDRLLSEGHTVIAMDESDHRQHRQHRPSGRQSSFFCLIEHDASATFMSRDVDACCGCRLPARWIITNYPIQTLKVGAGNAQGAGLAKARMPASPLASNVGGLRRSRRIHPQPEYWGNVNPVEPV